MASSVIHMCAASEVNKYLNKDNKGVLIGSIALDISKHINETKEYSHFLDNVDNDIPNFKSIIKEIPMNKLNLIIDKAGLIIKNSKESKSYIFDIEEINKFIEFCVSDIITQLEKV